jgi:uncharacterized protein YdeI (YjbR/CyaY-like superfamily)
LRVADSGAMRAFTPSMEHLAASAVRFVSRPVKRAIHVELPAELDDALASNGGSLRQAFARLSEEQRVCYVDWVGAGPTDEGRRQRAELVCSVVRVLAS